MNESKSPIADSTHHESNAVSTVDIPISHSGSSLERLLKPKRISVRYPFVGKRLLWMTCAFGSLGDGLFGYDQGIIAGLLVNPVFVSRFFKNYGGADGSTDNVDSSITGIMTACLQASAILGALIAGRLGDIIGRKRAVHIGGFIYLTAAFIQAFAPNFTCFIVGRTYQGIGVGFLSMTVPLIQAEIASPHRRGLMVGIEYTFLIGGYALSTWVDFGCYYLLPANTSWRVPYFVQMGFSFILFFMSFFLPETPRWLAMNGFMRESKQTIADLHADGDINADHINRVFLEIEEAVLYERTLGQST